MWEKKKKKLGPLSQFLESRGWRSFSFLTAAVCYARTIAHMQSQEQRCNVKIYDTQIPKTGLEKC